MVVAIGRGGDGILLFEELDKVRSIREGTFVTDLGYRLGGRDEQ